MEKRLVPWFVIPLVCLVGAGFAFASLWTHTTLMYGLNVGPSFCNISAHINCDAVSQSRFSKIFGLPLDGFGLAFYSSLFVLSLAALRDRLVSQQHFADALFALAFLACAFSIYLLLISTFVIKALCILCVGMYFANFTLLLIGWGLNRQLGFKSRLTRGIRELLSVPGALASGAPGSSRAARFGLAALVLALIVGSLSMHKILAPIIAARSPQQQQINEVLELALADWRQQQVADIPLQTEGAMQDYAKGKSFAPLRIVEFSDYECPACRAFHGALEEILKTYGDRIHFVLKNYPLDQACNPTMPFPMHVNACFLANAARCAGEQGKFWEMNDRIFTLPEIDEGKGPEEVMKAVYQAAAGLNIDQDGFKDCIYSGRQLEKIRQDIREGGQLGLQGTPSLWINGRKVRAANPIILEHLLEHADK